MSSKPGEKNITTTQRLFSISLNESSLETIKKCAQDRYTKATNKNFDSSRSHFFVLFFFSLGKKDVSLVIGDLRGKENCHVAGSLNESNLKTFTFLCENCRI